MQNKRFEQTTWNEDDFESMQWHDCKVHGIAFFDQKFELIFDIDYILEWINPKEGEVYFKFSVVPATLVFRNVYDLEIDLQSLTVQIQDIFRGDALKPKNEGIAGGKSEYQWTIETTDGHITFRSLGYDQYSRDVPRLSEKQFMNLLERNGISFLTNS